MPGTLCNVTAIAIGLGLTHNNSLQLSGKVSCAPLFPFSFETKRVKTFRPLYLGVALAPCSTINFKFIAFLVPEKATVLVPQSYNKRHWQGIPFMLKIMFG